MTALFDLETIGSARAALDQPIAVAEGLPGRFYGEEFFGLERERLFPGSWCAVTVGSALPDPGDVLPIDVAGWPVLIVRDRRGELKAFHNICRHRGIKLVAEATNAARISCPWHAWTYSLDGALLATPDLGGDGVSKVEGFAKPALGLKPIRLGHWLDLVFINIDGKAVPFADYIAPVEALLADCDFSRLRHGARIDDEYEGNWKIAMESGIEDYHLTFGHPQLDAHLYRNTTPCVHKPVYAGGYTDVGPGAAAHAGERAWTARLPDLRTRAGGPLPRLYSLTLFPTATILITADHVMLGTLLPDGARRTLVDLHLYYDGDAADDPALEAARQDTLGMWLGVIPQDKPFIEAAQATIEARDSAGVPTRFSPYWEAGVRGFQQMVVEAVA